MKRNPVHEPLKHCNTTIIPKFFLPKREAVLTLPSVTVYNNDPLVEKFTRIKTEMLKKHRRAFDLKCFVSDRKVAVAAILKESYPHILAMYSKLQNNVPFVYSGSKIAPDTPFGAWWRHDGRPEMVRIIQSCRDSSNSEMRANYIHDMYESMNQWLELVVQPRLVALSQDKNGATLSVLKRELLRSVCNRLQYEPTIYQCKICGAFVIAVRGNVVRVTGTQHGDGYAHRLCAETNENYEGYTIPHTTDVRYGESAIMRDFYMDDGTITRMPQSWLSSNAYFDGAYYQSNPNESALFRSYSEDVLNHYKMQPTEDSEATGMLFGVELEINRGEVPLRHCLQAIHNLGYPAIFKRDGSLQTGGFEMVTAPCGIEKHQSMWPGLFASDVGKRLVVDESCGLHVHVTRPKDKMQIARMLVLANSSECDNDWNKVWVTVARRGSNRYAASKRDLTTFPGAAKHQKASDKDRYQVLNLKKAPTVEFRMFASSNKAEEVVAAVEMAHAVTRYCAQPIGMRDAYGLSAYAFLLWLARRDNRAKYPALLGMLSKLYSAKGFVPQVHKPENKRHDDMLHHLKKIEELAKRCEEYRAMFGGWISPTTEVVFGKRPPVGENVVREWFYNNGSDRDTEVLMMVYFTNPVVGDSTHRGKVNGAILYGSSAPYKLLPETAGDKVWILTRSQESSYANNHQIPDWPASTFDSALTAVSDGGYEVFIGGHPLQVSMGLLLNQQGIFDMVCGSVRITNDWTTLARYIKDGHNIELWLGSNIIGRTKCVAGITITGKNRQVVIPVSTLRKLRKDYRKQQKIVANRSVSATDHDLAA